jgi:starvation-inducible DNA-binding protein
MEEKMKNLTETNVEILSAPKLGIKDKNLKIIYEHLAVLLSSNYSLFIKIQNYHWNGKGPDFLSHHKLFEKMYLELLSLIDETAERISMIGFKTPGSFHDFIKLSKVKDTANEMNFTHRMIYQLIADHELIISLCRESLEQIEDFKDDVSNELIIKIIQYHEKYNWILRNVSANEGVAKGHSH